MKALILTQEKSLPEYKTVDDPIAKKGEVVLPLQAAALNHRDLWITKGQYPGIRLNTILGSDGVGEWNGEKYLINPNINWGDSETVQHFAYHILGMPTNGTFAEQIAIPKDRLHKIPKHLSTEQAAALPLGGLTAYRALFTKCEVKTSDRVLISGIGGGVALFACQFAIAAGAEVYVTSSSEEKIQKAIDLGAKGGYLYTQKDWTKQLLDEVGGVDAVVDSAAGDGFADLIKICNPAGRICFYGGTRGKINGIHPQLMFWKQLTVMGSTMGSDREFAAMIDFVAKHQIEPVVDRVFDLKDGRAALEYMKSGEQFGKIVLRTR